MIYDIMICMIKPITGGYDEITTCNTHDGNGDVVVVVDNSCQ